MWNQTAHVAISFVILCLSTLGIAFHTSKWLGNLEGSLKPWLTAPMGFVTLFSIIVLLRLGQPLTNIPLAQIFLLLSVAYGLWNLLRMVFSQLVSYLKNIWFGLLPYLMFSMASLMVRGGLPYSVSDAWTHTSYINRISASDSALILGSHLPTDGKYFSFSPTSIFLSTLNDVSGRDSIATWNASGIFLGLMLLSASISFLLSIRLLPIKLSKLISAVSVLFILLYPTADLVSGWAGYSMTGSIFLFLVLALTVQCSVHEDFDLLSVIPVLIGFVMSMNHPVESITGILMMIPLFALPHISKRRLVKLIAAFGVVSTIGGLVFTRLLNSEILNGHNFSTSWPGVENFANSISPFLNWRLLTSTIFCLIYLWFTGRHLVVKYFTTCAVTIILMGPLNPLFFPLWVRIMGQTIMYRFIFALPIWILLGGFFSCFFEDTRSIRMKSYRERFFLFLVLVCVTIPLGQHLLEKFGSTGYYGSDAQSQLKTLPNFYKEIQGYNNKVFLTDIWTGAPIPTISSNFIVVHRPWSSGIDNDRWGIGRETMRSLNSKNSHMNMCKWGVDYVVINNAELPLMTKQFLASPWLLPDFYNSTIDPLPNYLRDVNIVDRVRILEFDKKMCVNS
ncbi:MAG: hypothetical protein WCR08_12230 [Gammaproteobacteria bacterium]